MSGQQRGETRAIRSVAVAFWIGAIGAVAFMVVFARGASTQWLGVTLAIAFGGIGYGLVALAHRLLPPGGAVEHREHVADAPEDQQEAADALEEPLPRVARRPVLMGGLLTALGATGLATLLPLRSLGRAPGDALRRTGFALAPQPRLVTEDGDPVHRDDLPVGGFITVYPEGHTDAADAQTVLIRMDMGEVQLRPPTRADWVADGYIAYSKICTHAGCAVGEYQVELLSLLCPCHQSAFQIDQGAQPTLGPATRPLPQLPLGLDRQGYVIALADYPEAVGPGWWSRP